VDRVEPPSRISIGIAPPVSAVARVRRRDPDPEENRKQGRNDGHERDDQDGDDGDDGLPHVDVLA
jgi:hypothetical protein